MEVIKNVARAALIAGMLSGGPMMLSAKQVYAQNASAEQLISAIAESEPGSARAEPGRSFWEQLDQQYCYRGDDLGVRWDAAERVARFRLWAPSAASVQLILIDITNGNKELGGAPFSLNRDVETGVWSLDVFASELGVDTLMGVGYRFLVDGRSVLDPYARSLALDDEEPGTAAIIDTSTQFVGGYARIPGYRRRTDAVVYELSVRDFTSDPDVESSLEGAPFGTFDALLTQLDYLSALGITHVQLMPVTAWYRSDALGAREREDEWSVSENRYNRGFDPRGLFALEATYSSNPRDPQSRVDEFKRLVNAIHARGMGVVLDVTFNHASLVAMLDAIEPGYFVREQAAAAESAPVSSSESPADLASERCMARKLIIDSLRYWTQQYKVDGFYVDRMGLLDARTMTEAHQSLSALNPQLLIYGDGRRLYDGQPQQMADNSWVLTQDFASVLSTDFKQTLIGLNPELNASGLLAGEPQSVARLLQNLRAQPIGGIRVDSPGDAVQYLSTHDSMTLHDEIAVALNLDPGRPGDQIDIQRRIRLANVLQMTAQGMLMLQSGQEYGRSKRWLGEEMPVNVTQSENGVAFVAGSDAFPDLLNQFDWSAIREIGIQADTARYTAGLITLRRLSESFRLGSTEAIYRRVSAVDSPDISTLDLVVGWSVVDVNGGSTMVLVNADSRERVIRIEHDTRDAQVLVDGKTAGVSPIASPVGVTLEKRAVRLAPLTAAVLRFPL